MAGGLVAVRVTGGPGERVKKADGIPFYALGNSGNRRGRDGRTHFRKKRRTSLWAKIDRNGKEWQKVGRSGAWWGKKPALPLLLGIASSHLKYRFNFTLNFLIL